MNIKLQFECQACLRTYDTEDDAINCHPVRQVYVCGHCGLDFDDKLTAEYCGTEDAKWNKAGNIKFKAEDVFNDI